MTKTKIDPEQIYAEIKKVSRGSVISYRELAKRTGFPGAIRAIATIVGKNKKPIIIPCHRIIRTNGEVGEYTFIGKRDIAKKIELLQTEGVIFEKHKNSLGKSVYLLKQAKKGAIL